MRICFFNEQRLGLVSGDEILDVSQALESLPASRYPFARSDLLIERLNDIRPKILAAAESARRYRVADVELKSPVLNPGKIVAAPVNYANHLAEAIAEPETFSAAHVRRIQETGLFLKATSSLIGAGSPILIRHPQRRTDHEIELVVVIGRHCDRVRRAEALEYVAGYCIGLDITIRGPEERSLRKSLDTYSVLGPWLVTADEIPDPAGLELVLDVNGETRQRANTRDLILGVPELIEFASSYYSLEPGDLLFTGTPEGVGPIVAGDQLVARIESIGSMTVEVAASPEPGL
jgi:2-keto-4-pentenoate hydratase/2-oxohepta-3-ene-1,7-dioic acid hydratase in catechol pathway